MSLVSASFHVGPKGRVVLPAAVRRAAGMDEGAEVVATVDRTGRLVLETTESVRERVWAAAPSSADLDATADIRAQRRADSANADAASARRSAADHGPDAGAALLGRLGL
jgi:bifunctional DNA-binding transcriptional regulator/antitoxin component of YhaV-PrlF toxin-antitoxin module